VTRSEAFELLGLSEDASENQITARWRELLHPLHKDGVSDDVGALMQLNEARAIALGKAPASDLVPMSQVTDIVRAATGEIAVRQERQERLAETQKLIKQVVRTQTSPLRSARRRLGLYTLLAAILAGASQFLRALPQSSPKSAGWFGTGISSNSAGWFATAILAYCGITAAVLGLLIVRHTQHIAAIQDAIDDANDTLDDKSSALSALREIRPPDAGRTWSRDELIQNVTEWAEPPGRSRTGIRATYLMFVPHDGTRTLAECAEVIGSPDFAKLLIAKLREHNLVSEQEFWEDRDHMSIIYELTSSQR
jgi:hypothetical protein